MGYRVQYGPLEVKPRRPGGKWPFWGLVCIFFALFCVFAQHFFRDELALLYQILLPNTSVETLIKELRDGENLFRAVAAFCEDVLHGS